MQRLNNNSLNRKRSWMREKALDEREKSLAEREKAVARALMLSGRASIASPEKGTDRRMFNLLHLFLPVYRRPPTPRNSKPVEKEGWKSYAL
jgi:hypothetical protein